MAITKQVVPISLFQGIDTKTDNKVSIEGKFVVAENWTYDKTLKLRKRNGYDQQSLQTTTGTTITDGKKLAKYKEELLVLTDASLYSKSNSIDKFINKGAMYNIVPESTPIIRNPFQQTSLDSIIVEGIKVFVWNDSSGGCRYSVMDSANNNFLVSNGLISSTGTNARLGQIQNVVYIFFVEGVRIKYRKFSILNPTILTASVTVAANVNGTFPIVATDSALNRVYVSYNNSTANQVSIFYIDSGDLTSSITSIGLSIGDYGIDIKVDEQSRVVISYCGAGARFSIYNTNLTMAIVGGALLDGADYRGIAVIQEGDGLYRFYMNLYASPASNISIDWKTADTSGATGVTTNLVKGLGLAARPMRYNNKNYLVTLHESTAQSTIFLLDQDANVVSKLNPGIAGAIPISNSLPKINAIDSNTFTFADQIKTSTQADNGVFFSVLGVNDTNIDFLGADTQNTAFLANNLHISGGIVRNYDGSVVTEHGFLIYPENLTAGTTGTTTGVMSNGTYEYLAVYSWTDNQGQIHRSNPSSAISVTLSGGGTSQFQNIIIPTLRLTEKQNVIIELYRTENNGTIFYRTDNLYGAGNQGLNDKTVNTITIKDGTSDSELIQNEVLYTTGGVLENIAPPAAKIIGEFKNRIVLAGLEDPNQIQYSKDRFEGAPVEFNDILTRQVKNFGGAITAIQELDEKMIIFREDAIYYMSGSGPNNLGEQDDFTGIQPVTNDVGCINTNSIVQNADGIYFKSRKGIYILGRNMGLEYIGADVEDFNDLNITSARIVPKFNQIRFLTSDGDCLVYNYFVKLWSTFTNHQGISSETLDNEYFYLRQNSALWKYNETSYNDNGSFIKNRIITSWLSFNQIQGFQRIYKALFLGEYLSPHTIIVKTAFNFNEAFVHSVQINVADFINENAYGDESPYGSGSPYGSDGDGNAYQFRINMKRQKCESIKILIEDSQTIPGPGMTLSAMTLEIGGKYGDYKTNQNRNYGTSNNTN